MKESNPERQGDVLLNLEPRKVLDRFIEIAALDIVALNLIYHWATNHPQSVASTLVIGGYVAALTILPRQILEENTEKINQIN